MPAVYLATACVGRLLDKHRFTKRLGQIRTAQRNVADQLEQVQRFSRSVHRAQIADRESFEELRQLREELRRQEVAFQEKQVDLELEAETLTASIVANNTLYDTLTKATGEDFKNVFGNAYRATA